MKWLWFDFKDGWDTSSSKYLFRHRVWLNGGKWTPFIVVSFRYPGKIINHEPPKKK